MSQDLRHYNIRLNKIAIMRIIFTVLIFISLWGVAAQELTQESATVNFKIKNMGFNVDGSFYDVSIKTNFNATDLGNSYIKGAIKVSSINTENDKRDTHLRNADYFDVETFETIKFSSTSIKKTSNNSYQLTGTLTIKDKSKTITVPLEFTETTHSATLTSSFSINRLDYEVGESSWIMADTVKLEINYLGNK